MTSDSHRPLSDTEKYRFHVCCHVQVYVSLCALYVKQFCCLAVLQLNFKIYCMQIRCEYDEAHLFQLQI